MAVNLIQGKQIATASWAQNAVSASYTPQTQNLQSVTDLGNSTTNSLITEASFNYTSSNAENYGVFGNVVGKEYSQFAFYSRDQSEDAWGTSKIFAEPETGIVIADESGDGSQMSQITLSSGDLLLTNLTNNAGPSINSSIKLWKDHTQLYIYNNDISEGNTIEMYPDRTYTKKYITTDAGFIGEYLEAPSITGSLLGTASFAVSSSRAISSSFATTASFALNALTASFVTSSNVFGPFGSNSIISASFANYAATASNAQNAQDILIYVKNTSGAQINKGKVVRISGATGDNALIATASYESDGVSANTLGITTQNIPNDSFGYVMTEGTLLGINTNSFSAGQLLYLGPTGSIIGTAPVAPLHNVRLGQVLRDQQNNGSMYVRIDNGYELGELHDVRDTSTTTSYGDLLVKSGSVWVNSNQLSGSYGLTGSLTATSITGSLFGTASFAVSSSFATTSSTARTLQGLYSIKITSSSSAVTGTVAETQVLKVEIPANSLTLNEIINMPLLIMSKTGTAGTCEIRVKISTASTMPSGNTDAIARYSSGASNLFAKIQRDFIIDNGTIKVYPLSSNLIDNTTSAVAILTKAFDPTIVNYLYVSLQQSAAGDSSVLQGFYLTN